MKIDTGIFTVVTDENVTIDVTPSFGAGNQVDAVRDGDQSLNPLVFQVTKSPGQQHNVEMNFGFVGASDGAQYTIKINGDAAGNQGPFTRFVRKSSPSHHRTYDFRVV
jgi:hypothetical protein